MKPLRTTPDAPNFDQAADLADDFTELYYEEAGQEYRPRKQK